MLKKLTVVDKMRRKGKNGYMTEEFIVNTVSYITLSCGWKVLRGFKELRAGTDGGRLHPYKYEVDLEALIKPLKIFISLCSFAYASINILAKVATDLKFFCACCKLYHQVWPLCGLVSLRGYLHLSPQLPLLLL